MDSAYISSTICWLHNFPLQQGDDISSNILNNILSCFCFNCTKLGSIMKKPTEQTPYVFVYGTLMSGFGNNKLLRNSALIDQFTTEDEYTLVANGIPYLLDNEGKSYVVGEVYEVNERTLQTLDDLEGHPGWYERRIINVISDMGDKLKAWAYFMPKKPTGVSVIESGDYRSYTESLIFNNP